MSTTTRLSGLQKDVLNLYRKVLRQAEKSSLPWSYSKARGGKLSKALEESINAEFLVIGQSRGALNATGTMRPGRILLIDNHSQRLFQALDVVLDNFIGLPFELLFVPRSSGISANTTELLSAKLSSHPQGRLVELNPESNPGLSDRRRQANDIRDRTRSCGGFEPGVREAGSRKFFRRTRAGIEPRSSQSKTFRLFKNCKWTRAGSNQTPAG